MTKEERNVPEKFVSIRSSNLSRLNYEKKVDRRSDGKKTSL